MDAEGCRGVVSGASNAHPFANVILRAHTIRTGTAVVSEEAHAHATYHNEREQKTNKNNEK